jgi:hypothetical protein
MKKILLAMFTFSVIAAAAQVPSGFNYQAVARNSAGVTLPNQRVNLRFSVHDIGATGTIVYQETDTATTNGFGLFTTVIGGGNVTMGTFGHVDWASANKFLQVEMDPTGGTTFTNIGTSQLQSVPYAQVAASLSNTVAFSARDISFTDIPSNGSATIPFDSVDFVTGGGYSGGAFTAPVAGVYHFDVTVVVSTVPSSNGYEYLQILKNGNMVIQKYYNTEGQMDYSGMLQLATGDVITVGVVNHNSNQMQYGDSFAPDTYFSGFKVY